VASSPMAMASNFAAHALKCLGESVPHKLSQQVALWGISDVKEWIAQVRFELIHNQLYSNSIKCFQSNYSDRFWRLRRAIRVQQSRRRSSVAFERDSFGGRRRNVERIASNAIHARTDSSEDIG
jgi:hypothetical protein